MRRYNEFIIGLRSKRLVLDTLVGWIIQFAQKRPFVRRFFQRYLKLFMFDIRYNISGKICIFAGIFFIITALLEKDGWTTKEEFEMLLSGISVFAIGAWLTYDRVRQVLYFYGKWYGVIAEWKKMVFDIRESYLNTLQQKLENELPGIVVHGRYEARGGCSKETEPTVHVFKQQWENRPGKKLRAICWVWDKGEKEVRLEYRRALGNIYAGRLYQTKGLEVSRHNEIKTIIDEHEWSCEPRFGWVCRLGFFKIASIVSIVVVAILWNGVETLELILKFDITSNGIITYARWIFLQIIVTFVFVIVVTFARGHYFPAGVFRVDEEKLMQKEKERTQNRVIIWFIGVMITIVITIVTPHLIDTCTTKDSESTISTTFLRETNLCWLIRNYSSAD